MRKSVLLVLLGLLVTVMVAAPVFASATNNVMVKPEGDESPPGVRQTCPANTIFGQEPVGPNDAWAFLTSDDGPTPAYLAFDNFSGAAGTNRIRFFGINAANIGGWAPCTEEPMPFEIIFYTDVGGQPGAAIATYNVSLTPVHTGIMYSGLFELLEWETALSPAPPVGAGAGWVSIQGISGDPDCWFLWANSLDGDLSCYQSDGSTMTEQIYDLAFCLIVDPTEECEWNYGDPHKMHFPQLPDELGWDVNATQPVVLADDFLCTETGFIRDFHFWGSWRHGIEGQILMFVLSIHADIPADQSPTGYSMPGPTLWEAEVWDFGFIPIDPPAMEGWYDPSTGEYFPDDHQAYFQYNICIDEAMAFWQDEGVIYWFNISAIIEDPIETQWGWKSTLDHWNDDAVWAFWGDLDWIDMYEPGTGTGYPYIPGDVDGDGDVDNDDLIYLQNWLFGGGPPPPYSVGGFYPAADVDGNCTIDLADFAYLAAFLAGGPPPLFCPQYPPGEPGISLDLSFVITTEVDEPTGACCFDPTGVGINSQCVVTTQADCENNLFGVYEGDGTTCFGVEACCLPDGTCLDADALCCLNELGGVPQGPGTQCTQLEACCFPDGTCADLDPLCCLDLGGAPQGPGTQCTALEACCFAPGAGDCMMLDPLCCIDLGGIPQGPGTQCSQPEACCMQNGSCTMLDPLCCVEFGGTPQGAGTTCSAATEACCFTDGSCQDLDPLCCDDLGGVAQGPGTVCLGDNNGNTIDDACEDQTGACCLPDDTCIDGMTQADCEGPATNGTYMGDGSVCLGDNNGNGKDDLCESWVPGDGHKMHYPQLPNPLGWDVNATQPLVLADDWMCSETGPVKDIHFWGSWKDGLEGQIAFFVLSIHTDIPASQNPDGYSKPGLTLWEAEISNFGATAIDPQAYEGWYDPATGEVLPNNHTNYFQYDVFLPEHLWFDQEVGTIYWLNISAVLIEPTNAVWGWKSTLDNWNDDAVWAFWGDLNWVDLWEPTAPNWVSNQWMVGLGPTGELMHGDGENAYGQGWYFYPEDNWWNIWFYDHPFDSTRYKMVHIEFDAYPIGPESWIEVAINWSTDLWSLDQPPGDSTPPLPGVPEQLYIGRQTVYNGPPQGFWDAEIVIPDYNPEWISVDVRGYNVDIPFGRIDHACVPDQHSLDLAFVITGGGDCDCEPGNANGDATINITDAVYLISYIFGGGPAPTPYPICSGDANCDCVANITDAVYLIQWIFGGGPAPCDCPTWLAICGPPLR